MKHQLCVFLFSLNLIVVFFFGTKLQFQTILIFVDVTLQSIIYLAYFGPFIKYILSCSSLPLMLSRQFKSKH